MIYRPEGSRHIIAPLHEILRLDLEAQRQQEKPKIQLNYMAKPSSRNRRKWSSLSDKYFALDF
jgi:hypothetical protein